MIVIWWLQVNSQNCWTPIISNVQILPPNPPPPSLSPLQTQQQANITHIQSSSQGKKKHLWNTDLCQAVMSSVVYFSLCHYRNRSDENLPRRLSGFIDWSLTNFTLDKLVDGRTFPAFTAHELQLYNNNGDIIQMPPNLTTNNPPATSDILYLPYVNFDCLAEMFDSIERALYNFTDDPFNGTTVRYVCTTVCMTIYIHRTVLMIRTPDKSGHNCHKAVFLPADLQNRGNLHISCRIFC